VTPDNASSSRSMPNLNCYAWEKFPEDTDLALALTFHRMQQQKEQAVSGTSTDSPVTASEPMVNRNVLALYQAPANERPQRLIDFLNRSALKNDPNSAIRWQSGTLDVLAEAQHGLETFNDAEQMFAVAGIIKALPEMEDQTQAREFARALPPLFSNWLKKPTENKSLNDVDSVKNMRLVGFFRHVNGLDESQDISVLEPDTLRRNAIGIQHAFYTAFPRQIFEVLDEALSPGLVQNLTKKLKQIGDKLLSSPEFANDLGIKAKRDEAEQHYEAAGERRAALGKELARSQETAASEKSGELKQILSPHARAGAVTSDPSRSRATYLTDDPSVHASIDESFRLGTQAMQAPQRRPKFPSDSEQVDTARGNQGPSPALVNRRQVLRHTSVHIQARESGYVAPVEHLGQPTLDERGDDTIHAHAKATQDPQLHPTFPSQLPQALPIRTRTPRNHLRWLPGKLGSAYPPAFSLPAPPQATQHNESQPSAPPGFSDFVVDRSSDQPVPKNVRVKEQPKHDSPDLGRAFTLTDSNGAKLDIHTEGYPALEKRLLRCRTSPNRYWNFRGNENDGWRAHPSKFVPQSATSQVLQKILHSADSADKGNSRDNSARRAK
jgi:hypothetical protein